jgi:hypothetical protein
MSTEILISKEFTDILEAEGGRLVMPRELARLAMIDQKFRVLQYLYQKAKFQNGTEYYKGEFVHLKKGQLIIGIRQLAKEIKMSYQQTRAAIDFLSDNHFLTQQTTHRYTIITLGLYSIYNSFEGLKQRSNQHSENAVGTQLPDKNYIVSIGSDPLTNEVTKDVTIKEDKSDSPRIESPAPEPPSKEKPEEETPPSSFPYEERFNEFWEAYPKRKGIKVGKQAALNSFKKIIKDGETLQKLMKATKNYFSQELPKDASRFLKDKFWEDWIDQAPQIQTDEKKSVYYPKWKAEPSMEVSNMKSSSIDCPFENYRAQDPNEPRKDAPEEIILRSDDPGAARRAREIVEQLVEGTGPKKSTEREPVKRESIKRDAMTEEQKELRKAELRRQGEQLKKGGN